MKKILLTALLGVCTAASAHKVAKLTPSEWTGSWQCTTAYNEINALTIDQAEYRADQTVSVKGTVTFDLGEKFTYGVDSEGTWKLDNNILSLKLKDTGVVRKHSPELQAMLAKEPALRAIEEQMYSIFQPDEKDIVLKLSSYTSTQSVWEQQDVGESTPKSECVRVNK